MTYTIPADNHVVSDTGHTTDHNNIADVLTKGLVSNVLNTSFSGGADPTGVADSAAAINAAIAAMAAFGGGTVRIPHGTYKLSSAALQQASGVRILGDGPLATILKPTGSNNGINVTAASADIADCAIEDLQVQGPGSGTGIGINGIANSGASNVARLAVRRVLVTLMGGDGIQATNAILSEMSQVHSTANLGRGFYANTGTTWHISACFFEDNASNWGAELNGISSSTLVSCGSDRNGGGWWLTGCNDVAMVSCDSFSTAAAGSADGTSFKIDTCFGINLFGAYVSGNAAIGVWFTGGSYGSSVWGVTETATGSPTASIQTDAGTNVYIAGYNLTTAPSYAPGTVALVSGAFSVFGAAEIQSLTTDNPVTVNGGLNTSGSAPALTPTFASGTAAQLSDHTRDYEVYLQFGAAGTAMSVAIGPTSTPANTLVNSAAVVAGEVVRFRVPAGWFTKVSFTTTTLAHQAAIGC